MSTVQPADQIIAADQAWSERMAASVIRRHTPEDFKWHYEHGLMLQALDAVGRAAGQPEYRRFVRAAVDRLVAPDGEIAGYAVEEYNLDQINPGKLLFPLYRETCDTRYRRAIDHLCDQLAGQPRTPSGGFWHKKIYPNQMWLDGVYMAAPFYAEYGQTFGDPAAFDDIARQIALLWVHARDPQTGLLYHAWDELRQERWADPASGCSPHFWGRSIGWFAMALVDLLGFFPAQHPRRPELLATLRALAESVARVQDPDSGLWYQVLDYAGRPGNYLEASASCMFVYAAAKGVRLGYLPAEHAAVAARAYQGLLGELVTVDQQGLCSLEGICSVAGLGGDPYRDGSYAYYVGERVVANDFKGLGPFILAALEIERAQAEGRLRHEHA